MVGLDIPVIPVEHQYIVTEPHPRDPGAPAARACPRWACCARPTRSWYMREEAGGLLLGPYEKGAPGLLRRRAGRRAEYELFQEDLDRLAPHIETAIVRVPAFGEVGIKKVYNGAIAYTPDGTPDHRPGLGRAEFLAQRGPFLRRHGRRRRRLAARRVDRRRRAHHRHAGRRSAPLRPLRLAAATSGPRTRRPTPTSSRRIIRTRSASAARPLKTRAVLRPHEGARRGVRLGLWLGAAQLVRPARLRAAGRRARQADDVLTNENHAAGRRGRQGQGEVELPPLQLFPLRRRRDPERHRQRRPAGHVALRQGDRLRAGRARPGSTRILANRIPKTARPHRALPPADQPMAACGPSSPSTSARPASSTSSRPARWSATTTTSLREAAARRRQRALPADHDGLRRAGPRRPALARAAAEAHRHRPVQRRLPLADGQADLGRAGRRAMRCASTSSASSAGSCITRSRCRTRCSTC